MSDATAEPRSHRSFSRREKSSYDGKRHVGQKQKHYTTGHVKPRMPSGGSRKGSGLSTRKYYNRFQEVQSNPNQTNDEASVLTQIQISDEKNVITSAGMKKLRGGASLLLTRNHDNTSTNAIRLSIPNVSKSPYGKLSSENTAQKVMTGLVKFLEEKHQVQAELEVSSATFRDLSMSWPMITLDNVPYSVARELVDATFEKLNNSPFINFRFETDRPITENVVATLNSFPFFHVKSVNGVEVCLQVKMGLDFLTSHNDYSLGEKSPKYVVALGDKESDGMFTPDVLKAEFEKTTSRHMHDVEAYLLDWILQKESRRGKPYDDPQTLADILDVIRSARNHQYPPISPNLKGKKADKLTNHFPCLDSDDPYSEPNDESYDLAIALRTLLKTDEKDLPETMDLHDLFILYTNINQQVHLAVKQLQSLTGHDNIKGIHIDFLNMCVVSGKMPTNPDDPSQVFSVDYYKHILADWLEKTNPESTERVPLKKVVKSRDGNVREKNIDVRDLIKDGIRFIDAIVSLTELCKKYRFYITKSSVEWPPQPSSHQLPMTTDALLKYFQSTNTQQTSSASSVVDDEESQGAESVDESVDESVEEEEAGKAEAGESKSLKHHSAVYYETVDEEAQLPPGREMSCFGTDDYDELDENEPVTPQPSEQTTTI